MNGLQAAQLAADLLNALREAGIDLRPCSCCDGELWGEWDSDAIGIAPPDDNDGNSVWRVIE